MQKKKKKLTSSILQPQRAAKISHCVTDWVSSKLFTWRLRNRESINFLHAIIKKKQPCHQTGAALHTTDQELRLIGLHNVMVASCNNTKGLPCVCARVYESVYVTLTGKREIKAGKIYVEMGSIRVRSDKLTGWGVFTSFRALSSLGLLSSTLSLDCCFSFLSRAVTERHRGTEQEQEKGKKKRSWEMISLNSTNWIIQPFTKNAHFLHRLQTLLTLKIPSNTHFQFCFFFNPRPSRVASHA